MKKLIGLIAGTGLLFGSCSSGSLIMRPDSPFPYEFQNYKKKAVRIFKGEKNFLGRKVHAHSYDLDGDHIPDVVEIFFEYKKVDETETFHSEFPKLYIINRGDDNNPENDMYFFDESEDGPNGNEKEAIYKFTEINLT